MAACDGERRAVPTSSDDTVILPLAIGNTWWGTSYVYNLADSTVDTSKVTIMVAADTIAAGIRWFDYSIYPPGPKTGRNWSCNRPDGLYRLARYFGDDLEPGLEVKFPARRGDIYLRGPDTVRVVSADSLLQVGGRAVRCQVHVCRTTEYGFTFIQYLSPGLGYVRMEATSPGDSSDQARVHFELDSALLL